MRPKRNHTTKLPSQVDVGDRIMLKGSTRELPVVATVVEPPIPPETRGDPWRIVTDSKVFAAEPSLRMPILLDETP